MSSPKQSKTGLGHLLTVGGSGGNSPRFVPPVLREVGKLAAGVASVSTTASATGNPRNKCVLKPGHSHIDWVRLSNSKDLSGLGENAGKLEVTIEELAKHNKITDGWLAINGKVFNVTSYFPFHPGGVEELKKGLGIDATKLFYEVHNWVNCDSLLKSCYVGRLLTSPQRETKESNSVQSTGPPGVPSAQPGPFNPKPGLHNPELDHSYPQPGPSTNAQTFIEPINIGGVAVENAFPKCLQVRSVEMHSYHINHEDPNMELTTFNHCTDQPKPIIRYNQLPKFKWIQKMDIMYVSFTIKPFSNPLVEIQNTDSTSILVTVFYNDKVCVNHIHFNEELVWPCHMRVTEENGTTELMFKKKLEQVWHDYGHLRQTDKMGSFPESNKISYVVRSKKEIACNIFLIELQRTDGKLISVPIGHHVRVFSDSDEHLSKSYTPIPKPSTIFPKPANATWAGDTIYLMVKRYDDGNISKHICDAAEGTSLVLSRPISPGFKLESIQDKDKFICLVAGTGITPILSLMLNIFQRRSIKCKKFATLFCNRKKEDIPFLAEFDELMELEKSARTSVKHILTQLEIPEGPNFVKGQITIDHVRDTVEEIHKPKKWDPNRDDLFIFVCGPPSFNDTCCKFLKELEVPDNQIFVFKE